MKNIKIFDTTLRDGEQSPGCSMNLNEKIQVARQLEKLGVDVIEAGFAIASPGDLSSIQAISKEVKNSTICSLARALEKDIDAAYESLKYAQNARIHTFIATSPVHMEHKLKMSPQQVLEQTAAMVAYAKKYVSDVEFSAEDACRSELPFLKAVLETAIKSGATVLNIPDTVGYITPAEMGQIISYLKQNVEGIDDVTISVHCHNDLGMAVANSLAAVAAGATQVECTINGIGERAGNAALEEVVMGIETRNAFYGAHTNIKTPLIYHTSRLVQTITGFAVLPNKAIIGANAFAHESGIHQHGVMSERTTYEIMTPQSVGLPTNNMVLGKHSGRHAFADRISQLGYTLSKGEIDAAFKKFKLLADKKKVIMDRDIEALIGLEQMPQVAGYSLDNFVINSGNSITSTATVKLSDGNGFLEQVAIGDGPVNAGFKAINMIVGKEFELDDYSLRSVTSGEDALGEASVKLSFGGATVTGRGVSTDIIEASLKAYINGVNKIMEIK